MYLVPGKVLFDQYAHWIVKNHLDKWFYSISFVKQTDRIISSGIQSFAAEYKSKNRIPFKKKINTSKFIQSTVWKRSILSKDMQNICTWEGRCSCKASFICWLYYTSMCGIRCSFDISSSLFTSVLNYQNSRVSWEACILIFQLEYNVSKHLHGEICLLTLEVHLQILSWNP